MDRIWENYSRQADIAGIGVEGVSAPPPQPLLLGSSLSFFLLSSTTVTQVKYLRMPVKGKAMIHVDGMFSEFLQVGTPFAFRRSGLNFI